MQTSPLEGALRSKQTKLACRQTQISSYGWGKRGWLGQLWVGLGTCNYREPFYPNLRVPSFGVPLFSLTCGPQGKQCVPHGGSAASQSWIFQLHLCYHHLPGTGGRAGCGEWLGCASLPMLNGGAAFPCPVCWGMLPVPAVSNSHALL